MKPCQYILFSFLICVWVFLWEIICVIKKKLSDILINVFNICLGNIILKSYNVLIVLYNRGMRVNLSELNFSSSHFSSQKKKKKKSFSSLHFSILQKHIWKKTKFFLSSYFSIVSSFFILSLFHPSNQIDLKLPQTKHISIFH